MSIETDALLLNDPCWRALENAAAAIEDNPRCLFEKIADWSDGLNAAALNRLAIEHVLCGRDASVVATEKTGEDRFILVFCPGVKEPIRLHVWGRNFYDHSAEYSKAPRAAAFLRAWRDRRAAQLRKDRPHKTAAKRKHRQCVPRTKQTAKQLAALEAYGECKGNYSLTAKRLGVSRSTAKQHVEAAYRKMGLKVPKMPRTQALPQDHRGNVNVDRDRRYA